MIVQSSQKKEIYLCVSRVPIIRSGYANLIFFLSFIALLLVNYIPTEYELPLLFKVLISIFICIVTLKAYACSVSRIFLTNENELVIEGPVSESTFNTSLIEKAEVYGIPSSMAIFFILKFNNLRFPKFFFFVAVSTNCGSYSATKECLTELLTSFRNVDVLPSQNN
jgi:hypothetical protein